MNRESEDVNLNERSENVVIEVGETGEDVVDGQSRRQQNAISYYHTKKSKAEGMMDISLLTANANQLKFILYFNQESKTFFPALVLIILSLILQITIGILLIFRRRFKSNGQKQRASLANEYLVLLIFLTTIINILVAVFSSVETSANNQNGKNNE